MVPHPLGRGDGLFSFDAHGKPPVVDRETIPRGSFRSSGTIRLRLFRHVRFRSEKRDCIACRNTPMRLSRHPRLALHVTDYAAAASRYTSRDAARASAKPISSVVASESAVSLSRDTLIQQRDSPRR